MARRRSPSSSRISPWAPLIAVPVLALLVGAGILLVRGELTIFGQTIRTGSELRAATQRSATPIPDHLVEVLVAASDLEAYTRVEVEHVFDPRSRSFTTVVLPRTGLPDSLITLDEWSHGALQGRVLRRDKLKGRAFSESDLFAEGTRDGLPAGIPAGRRGLEVQADQVLGLHELGRGDRFDIVATWRNGESRDRGPAAVSLLTNTGRDTDSIVAPTPAVQVLVQDGRVVRPVRPTPSGGGSAIQIAVTAEEAIRIAASLETGATLRCLVRSGQAEDDGGNARLPTEFAVPNPGRAASGEVLIVRDGKPQRLRTRRPGAGGEPR